MTWFSFELKNLGKNKRDSLSANFQSFIRIIVKMAKLGLSMLNRLQYIPIWKLLPNSGGTRALASARDFLYHSFHFRPTMYWEKTMYSQYMGGLKRKLCYKKSRVLASARMPPLISTSFKSLEPRVFPNLKKIKLLCLHKIWKGSTMIRKSTPNQVHSCIIYFCCQ